MLKGERGLRGFNESNCDELRVSSLTDTTTVSHLGYLTVGQGQELFRNELFGQRGLYRVIS